jgi:hypothetical protein
MFFLYIGYYCFGATAEEALGKTFTGKMSSVGLSVDRINLIFKSSKPFLFFSFFFFLKTSLITFDLSSLFKKGTQNLKS